MELVLKTAATGSDWVAAARLLDQYRCWLAAAVGLDLTAAQPAAGGEFGDLASFYRRPDGVLILAWLGECPVGMVACTGTPVRSASSSGCMPSRRRGAWASAGRW